MSLSIGINIPKSILEPRAAKLRPSETYLRWFIGFALTGLVYSAFAWSVLLAGNARSRVELALQLPMKGLIRLLEWVHCPEVFAFVVTLFPPLTALMCGVLALAACWAWRVLGLQWDRTKHVLAGTALFQMVLLGYACTNATLSERGPQGVLTLPGRGDSLLA
ncbi:MAG: hypothetical protein HY293_08930, partial [Planctomycetes bacterium]|nr:hypothetical protein [Planctomycetota bacterium]